MEFVIDSHSGVPIYRQIVDQVRYRVAGGLLQPGDELPSTRTLSQALGINPMTVSKAYALLESEGLLTHRPGLPLVVSEVPGEARLRERRAQLLALLGPVATAARELGLGEDEALEIFRDALGASEPEQEDPR